MNALGEPGSILLLGGTSDIGLAIVGALAGDRRPRVVLAGRDEAAMRAAALRVGVEAAIEPFDAEDLAGHEEFVGRMFVEHGDLDVVILAFGVLGDQAEAEADPAAAVAVGRVNYLGAMSVALPAAARLRAQGHGTLVVLSSVAAERPRRANFVYGSSKAGLDAFAQGLADALAGSGARVLVVRPGFVHTRMTAGRDPAPFATTPDRVAAEVRRGLARGSHTVWAPPILRWVMAVIRHLPRPIFRRLPR